MRAPWKWRWGQILALSLLWWVVGAVIGYAPILAIVLAAWLCLWFRQALDPQPLPSPTERAPLEDEEAGQSVEVLGGGAGRIVKLDSEYRHVEL